MEELTVAIGDIIVGLDIGTSKVSLVVGEVNNFNQIEIICNTSHKCNGIKKTKIIDEDDIALAISKVIQEAEIETRRLCLWKREETSSDLEFVTVSLSI